MLVSKKSYLPVANCYKFREQIQLVIMMGIDLRVLGLQFQRY